MKVIYMDPINRMSMKRNMGKLKIGNTPNIDENLLILSKFLFILNALRIGL